MSSKSEVLSISSGRGRHAAFACYVCCSCCCYFCSRCVANVRALRAHRSGNSALYNQLPLFHIEKKRNQNRGFQLYSRFGNLFVKLFLSNNAAQPTRRVKIPMVTDRTTLVFYKRNPILRLKYNFSRPCSFMGCWYTSVCHSRAAPETAIGENPSSIISTDWTVCLPGCLGW